ncbi:tyrosine-type recombinase/integrase [Methylobacterium sp. P31]
MLLSMKRHAKRSDSRYIQFMMRVPETVRERVSGRIITVDMPAHDGDPAAVFEAKLGRFVRGSLHTRNSATADIRHLLIRAELSKLYAAVKAGPAPLTQMQIEGLAGETYRLLIDEHGENPGTQRQWESFKALTRAAVEGRIPGAPSILERGRSDDEVMRVLLFGETEGEALTDTINGLAASWETRALEQRVGRLAFWVLQKHGLEVDDETRFRLLQRVAQAALDAGLALKKRAGGDYRPDPAAERFPPFQKEGRAAGVSLTDIFERWRKETDPAPATITTWRGILADFEKHLKHGDAARVTEHDVVGWKDARVAAGRAAKTINDSDLACLRALFRFAVTNKLLTRNPAEGIKVRIKKQAGEGRLPYTNDEVARLLAYAEKETLPHRRYVPLLAATTGSRVQDIVQLWAENVTVEDGVPVLRITPAADGGRLKNRGSERVIPIHPAVMNSGFIEFARSKGWGPLFYGAKPKRATGANEVKKHASKGTSNRVSEWVRTLPGFDDPRKAPCHSLRHWMKSAATKAGVLDSVANHIQGHTDSSVAGRYRHHDDLKSLAEALAKIQIPTLSKLDDVGAMPVMMDPVINAEPARPRIMSARADPQVLATRGAVGVAASGSVHRADPLLNARLVNLED